MELLLRARFEMYLHSRKKSIRSVSAYLNDINAFINWYEKKNGDAFTPASILRHDMADWRADMQSTCSPATINRRLTSLRIFFIWAQRENLTSMNPMVDLHNLKSAKKPATLPDRVINRLLAEVRRTGDLRDRAMLELLADTGLRVSELIRIQCKHLEDIEGQTWLTVPSIYTQIGRKLLIHPRARLVIRAHQEKIGELDPDAPLFSTRKKTPLSSYAVWYTVRKYAHSAGIREPSPRKLRAAAAKRYVTDPHVGLLKAAELLGQQQVESLVKYLVEEQSN